MRELLTLFVLGAFAACGGTPSPPPQPGPISTATAAVPAPEPAAAPGAGPSGDARAILDAHNQYRQRHCAPPLEWSDELGAVAQRWADQLAADGCKFDHSRSPYGENLAAGTESVLGPEHAAEMWYREIDKYDFGGGGFSMETGHFTQVVWVGSQRLGCGSSRCDGLRIWVCNYDPPGNVTGQYRENVLATTCRR